MLHTLKWSYLTWSSLDFVHLAENMPQLHTGLPTEATFCQKAVESSMATVKGGLCQRQRCAFIQTVTVLCCVYQRSLRTNSLLCLAPCRAFLISSNSPFFFFLPPKSLEQIWQTSLSKRRPVNVYDTTRRILQSAGEWKVNDAHFGSWLQLPCIFFNVSKIFTSFPKLEEMHRLQGICPKKCYNQNPHHPGCYKNSNHLLDLCTWPTTTEALEKTKPTFSNLHHRFWLYNKVIPAVRVRYPEFYNSLPTI